MERRKKKTAKKRNVSVATVINEELFEKLSQYCKETGFKKKEVIGSAIDFFMKGKDPNCFKEIKTLSLENKKLVKNYEKLADRNKYLFRKLSESEKEKTEMDSINEELLENIQNLSEKLEREKSRYSQLVEIRGELLSENRKLSSELKKKDEEMNTIKKSFQDIKGGVNSCLKI